MKTNALCALLVPVVAVGGFVVWPRDANSADPLPSPLLTQAAAAASALPDAAHAAPAAAPKRESVELRAAVEQGILKAAFRGNGRDKLRATLVNTQPKPVLIRVSAGQMLEDERNSIVIVRSGEITLQPGQPTEVAVQTAATRSANRVGDGAFRLSYETMPKLDALLAYAQTHVELTPGSIQTAVFALTENLPLSAVAKFTSASDDLPSRFDTTAFRVETIDLINALLALREVGVKDGDVAMTVDPQLKIEAMIEPLTRAAAMRYYGLTADNEWEYWKTELTSGDPTTRHYALYGIARFYPEVALEMLPKWAREPKTTPVYRLSAIQALADTQRAEALPILRELTEELGRDSELGRAAISATRYLDSHLAKLTANRATVAFRGPRTMAKF